MMNIICKWLNPAHSSKTFKIIFHITESRIVSTAYYIPNISKRKQGISTLSQENCKTYLNLSECMNCSIYSRKTKQNFPSVLQKNNYNYLPSNFANCTMKSKKMFSQFSKTRIYEKHLLNLIENGSPQKRCISFKTSAIVDAVPIKVQPYLRLIRFDKPIGTWLVYLPCAWSIAMAASPGCFPEFYYLGVCGIGALLMRGAGCTINDMWDKDFDKSVARTKLRPIAAGEITMFQALVYLGAQLSAAFAILLSFNTYSIVVAASSMAIVVTYPLMKRITFWPQAFLGLAMNWGILVGWSAVHGACDWSVVVPLYASGICWTIIYDTIYGHQDKSDDLALGLKSTSIFMGDNTKCWLTAFGALMVSNLAIAGYMCDQSLAYFLAVGLVAGHLSTQIWTLDVNSREDCWNKFSSNKRLGLILLAGIIAGTLGKSDDGKKDKTVNL